MSADLARLMSKVEMIPFAECWLFTGSDDGRGYGKFWIDGRVDKAHRASWLLSGRDIPLGQWVLHRCDVPCCVNPAHLFLGDRTDNMRDMASKGRQVFQVNPARAARGARVAGAKLDDEKVRAIKRRLADGASLTTVAAEFNVSKSTASHIRTGRKWGHVTGWENPTA